MKFLLVVATKNEIQPFLDKFDLVIDTEITYQFQLVDLAIDILITGVGITATSFALGQNLNANYDLVLNVGIAGSFDRKIELGEVINVVEDQFADLGAEDDETCLSLFDLGLIEENDYPYEKEKLVNNTLHKPESIQSLKNVSGITVNKVHGNKNSIEKIIGKYRPTIETMEGAAFFYACKMVGIPFFQIRAISNYVEKRDRDAWDIPLAVKNLNKKLIEVVNELANDIA